ncbi:hypothetical protein [Thalassobacter stenotrophicus]|uniref:hypothetical protein n=1 Tax=Thalassobacter stenotrophicus TaxID=266809 RepID=UPI000D5D472B|nr:hypothetical protein [Thalassobacter stenotrophicus]PVZ47914.1 hypothetical protein DD557_03630 [Thalassobacter stenotrophicus]
MPAKRRRAKSRRAVSARACEIYQANPDAIDGNLILDEDLAEELGRIPLIAYPDIQDLVEQLSKRRD